MKRPSTVLAFAATLLLGACANAPTLSTDRIAEILASPDRRAADRTNDIRRKPHDMLAFIGLQPGMVALDLSAGGMYVIADHSGRPGTGISESGTLHRVEEAFLRKEVEAAGFRLAEEGNFLRNPGDPRDKNTPNPPQPKDEFVLKFVKP